MRFCLVWVLASTLSGCAGSLPAPEEAIHRHDAYVEVPYPPPAALVEVIPEPWPAGAVWVDGNWVWRGRYYVWQRGGWMKDIDGLSYASWKCRLANDGRLLFAKGTWYDSHREQAPAPPIVKPAHTPPNEITVETEAPR